MSKLVIFDMDGLMFDTEPLYYEANQRTADKLGIPFDYAFYKQFIGASDADFFKAIYQTVPKEKADLFVDESRKDLKELFYSTTPKLKPGLRELLDSLKEDDVRLAVASSSHHELIDTLLEKADLTTYFDAVVGGDEVKQSKPSPEIFLKAAELTGPEHSDVIVLEDSLNGIRAGHSAGFKVIMVPDLIAPDKEAESKTFAICKDLFEVISEIKNAFRD